MLSFSDKILSVLSAGGHDEHPCDVYSSTTTGALTLGILDPYCAYRPWIEMPTMTSIRIINMVFCIMVLHSYPY